MHGDLSTVCLPWELPDRRSNPPSDFLEYLTAVKKEAKIPVMMGFGIRTAEDVRPMKEIIDGAIVGSHFITLMRKHDFDPQAAADYCSTFKKKS